MVYSPTEHPGPAIILITIVAVVGIVGGILNHYISMYGALLFWLLYTTSLIYMEAKKRDKKAKIKKVVETFVKLIMHPYVRYGAFIILSLEGLYGIITGQVWLAYLVLILWWIFSLNFYYYFQEQKKKEATKSVKKKAKK